MRKVQMVVCKNVTKSLEQFDKFVKCKDKPLE